MSASNSIQLNPTQYSILFIGSLTLLLLGVVFLTACQTSEEGGEETALAGEAISLGCTRSFVRSCQPTEEGITGRYLYTSRQFNLLNACGGAGTSATKYRCVSSRRYEVCRSTCTLATDICKVGECCQRTSPGPIINVCNGNVLTNTTDTTCGSVTYSYDCSSRRPPETSYRCDPNAPDGVIITPYNPETRVRETRGSGPGCVSA